MARVRNNFARVVTLAFGDWPAADKRAWHKAFPDEVGAACDEFDIADDEEVDPEEERDRLHSLRNPLQAVERYMAYLRENAPTVYAQPMAERFEEEPLRNFRAALPSDTTERKRTQLDYLARLFRVRRALLKEPAAFWQKRLINEIGYKASLPKASKLSTQAILDIGIATMRQALDDLRLWRQKHGCRPYVPRPAITYRDGLLVAMLALLALRMSNMMELRIKRSFFVRKSNEPYLILVINWKSRIRRKILRRVPKSLQSFIDDYLDIIRPELLQGVESDKFWVDVQQTALEYQGGYAAFVRTIWAARGVGLNPHMVRHAAADVLRATGAPDDVIAAMLGHIDLSTASAHYISVARKPKRRLCTAITGV